MPPMMAGMEFSAVRGTPPCRRITESCASDGPFPYKNFPDVGGVPGDPFCSVILLQGGVPLTAENSIPAIIGGIFGMIVLLGIFISYFGYQWRQRARAKENTAKMTM